jgi:hypothetical protein
MTLVLLTPTSHAFGRVATKIGTSTVYRSMREAIALLAGMAPTLTEAIEVARGKAFVILDGTLLRIDRVGMVSFAIAVRAANSVISHASSIRSAARPGVKSTSWRARRQAARSSTTPPQPPLRPGSPRTGPRTRRRGTRRRPSFLRRGQLPAGPDLLPQPGRSAGRVPGRPGGKISAIVYSTPERNGFFSVPVGIIRRRAQLPPPAAGQPGPFSLGRPGIPKEALRRPGFREVRSQTLAATLRMIRAAECVRFERESFGALRQMLAGLTPAEREQAWEEIGTELARFEGPGGFEGPCELIVAWGHQMARPGTNAAVRPNHADEHTAACGLIAATWQRIPS